MAEKSKDSKRDGETKKILDDLLNVVTKASGALSQNTSQDRLPIHMAVLNLSQHLVKTKEFEYVIDPVAPTHLSKKLIDNATKTILMLQDYQLHLYRTLIHKKKDEDFEIIRKSSLNFCHMGDEDHDALNGLLAQEPKSNPIRKKSR